MAPLIPDDAAETDMACRRIDRLRMARRRAIAPAIIGRAEMRAAFEHLARDPDLGLAWVITVSFNAAARIGRDAAGLRCVGRMPGRIPVTRPLPDIADHVVKAVA